MNEYLVTITFQTGETWEDTVYADSTARAGMVAIDTADTEQAFLDLHMKTISITRLK